MTLNVTHSSSLSDRARGIAPLLSNEAEACEREGALTPPVIEALRASGMLSYWLPKCFGGEETPPVPALEALEILSHADGSVGWVTMATQLCAATAAAYLAPSGAKAIFSEGPVIIGGQGQPNGKATQEGAGYHLQGHWNYGSGVRHADYLHTGGFVYRDGAPLIRNGASAPEPRIFIVPVRDAKLLENWDTLGLRATGSIDYAIEGAFVAEEFTHDLTANTPNQGGDLYRLGVPGFSAIGHTAFALGLARRALDELAAIKLQGKQPTYMLGAANDAFLLQYGSAEAKLLSVRALAFDVWSDIQRTLEMGDDLTNRQGSLMRLVVNHSTSVAAEISLFAFRFAGGHATRNGPIQRCFRDMQTGAQHGTASPPVLLECSREMLGLAQGKRWGFRNLV